MALLLKILGDQTVQLTVKSNGEPVTSWIIKTAQEKVEYIQVISGRSDQSTINMDIDLDDFKFNEGADLNLVESIAIVGKMFASNRGLRRQPRMWRLLTAGGVELVVGYLRGINRKVVKKGPLPHPNG
jgi:hypothetical protein